MALSFEVLLALLGDLGAESLPQLGHLRLHFLYHVHLRLILIVIDLRATEDAHVVDPLLQFLNLTFPVEGQDLLPPQLRFHQHALLILGGHFLL